MYRVQIKNSAKTDLKKLKNSTPSLRQSFEEVISVLKDDPYKNTQSFEKLIPKESGLYSRRINIQHRVVYSIDEEQKTVFIYSAWSHYE